LSFTDFELGIRATFERARTQAGDAGAKSRLELTEETRGQGAKADFYVLSSGTVCITWCAIAALWAASRAAAIILRRIEVARKKGNNNGKLMVPGDPDLTAAINLLFLCRRLYLDDFPQPEWPEWAPKPEVQPASPDGQSGNVIFQGALSWMIRHEIAHLTCRHNERQISEGLSTADVEREADWQATEWFRRGLRADPTREPGTAPDKDERELELRGLVLGMGLVWVAMLEASLAQKVGDYPSPAQRLYASLDQLGLREDSAAAQWLAEIIHAWIDPEADWVSGGGHKNAQAFFSEAVYRLQRYLADPAAEQRSAGHAH
jgi:hypothetical protein